MSTWARYAQHGLGEASSRRNKRLSKDLERTDKEKQKQKKAEEEESFAREKFPSRFFPSSDCPCNSRDLSASSQRIFKADNEENSFTLAASCTVSRCTLKGQPAFRITFDKGKYSKKELIFAHESERERNMWAQTLENNILMLQDDEKCGGRSAFFRSSATTITPLQSPGRDQRNESR